MELLLGFRSLRGFRKGSALRKDIVTGTDSYSEEPGRALKAVLWDLDGTLIDSEPYWHQVEIDLAHAHGGYWDEDLGWTCSGKPLPTVGALMVKYGTKLPVDEIAPLVVEGVERMEAEHLPWIPGVEDVLRSLVEAGIPSVLVTTSPRSLAQNLVDKAPKGAFVGFVCGDDDLPKKPNPAPYLAAARVVGIDIPQDIAAANGINGVNVVNGSNNVNINSSHADFYREMAQCVAFEDSMTGLRSAVASGATTIAQTGYIKTDTSAGPQFASINNYDGLTAEVLEQYVEQRSAALKS